MAALQIGLPARSLWLEAFYKLPEKVRREGENNPYCFIRLFGFSNIAIFCERQ